MSDSAIKTNCTMQPCQQVTNYIPVALQLYSTNDDCYEQSNMISIPKMPMLTTFVATLLSSWHVGNSNNILSSSMSAWSPITIFLAAQCQQYIPHNPITLQIA